MRTSWNRIDRTPGPLRRSHWLLDARLITRVGELLREPRDGNNYAATEAEGGEVAAGAEVVGEAAGDAEERGGFVDGERQALVLVGLRK